MAQMVSSRFNFSKTTAFSGWFFIATGSIFFLGFLFAAVISKLLPPFDNPILSAIQNDSVAASAHRMICGTTCAGSQEDISGWSKYYCFLVPLTLPIIVVAVYFHWLSMKLFKHA